MNRGQRKFYIKILILCLMLIVSFCATYLPYRRLQNEFTTISLRIKDTAVTKKQLMFAMDNITQQKKSHVPELTAYSMEEHIMVEEPNLERTVPVTIYHVYGAMNQVTPAQVITGNYVTTEDYWGCLMDQDTAFTLFGTTNVVGARITINDRSYYIRGVINCKMPMVMIQEEADTTEFWNLEFNYGKLKQGRNYATSFMMQFNLSQDYVIIEQNFIADCCGDLLVVPMIILMILVVFWAWRKIKSDSSVEIAAWKKFRFHKKREWVHFIGKICIRSWVVLLAVAAMATVMIITMKLFGTFPTRYLPSKWSDFNQYIRFYNEIKKHLDDLNYVTPTRREVLLKQYSMKCIFGCGATLLLIWHLLDLIWVKVKGNKDEGKVIK